SLLHRLLSDLAKLAAHSRTRRFPGQCPLARRRIPVWRICPAAEGRKLADHLARADGAHQQRGAKGLQIVMVDLIGEPRVTAPIGSRHVGELDAGSVGKDQAFPRDLYTLLPIDPRALVGADQFASLGHQKIAAGRGVKNILAYLSEDRSR